LENSFGFPLESSFRKPFGLFFGFPSEVPWKAPSGFLWKTPLENPCSSAFELLAFGLLAFAFWLFDKKIMSNKTVILALVFLTFAAKGFLVFNAESLVLFTFVTFVGLAVVQSREGLATYFADRGVQIEKEFYSARANVKAYFEATSVYLRFKLALLSALMVGVAFCKQASWSSLACAQARFKEQLRMQVVEKFKRVAVYESLGVVSLQSSVVDSVPAAITASFVKKSTQAKETVLSDSISHLETA
jgi:hypothetical protein